VLDIYALSADYDPHGEASRTFFKTVQNKLHWAAHGRTAEEVIASRADAAQPNMGQTSWTGAAPRRCDVEIAKNYLSFEEIEALNGLVSAYLEFAEIQAKNRRVMYMRDWIDKLDSFLRLADKDVLMNAGKISHEVAMDRANTLYDLFRKQQALLPSPVMRDFESVIAETRQIEVRGNRLEAAICHPANRGFPAPIRPCADHKSRYLCKLCWEPIRQIRPICCARPAPSQLREIRPGTNSLHLTQPKHRTGMAHKRCLLHCPHLLPRPRIVATPLDPERIRPGHCNHNDFFDCSILRATGPTELLSRCQVPAPRPQRIAWLIDRFASAGHEIAKHRFRVALTPHRSNQPPHHAPVDAPVDAGGVGGSGHGRFVPMVSHEACQADSIGSVRDLLDGPGARV